MINGYFVYAIDQEMHRVFKKQWYAYLYGHYGSKLLYRDFGKMYLMGGEL